MGLIHMVCLSLDEKDIHFFYLYLNENIFYRNSLEAIRELPSCFYASNVYTRRF